MASWRFVVDYDEEAGVWYIRESTLPGLRTEAVSLDELVRKLRFMVPDLLDAIEASGGGKAGTGEVTFEVIYHASSPVTAAA